MRECGCGKHGLQEGGRRNAPGASGIPTTTHQAVRRARRAGAQAKGGGHCRSAQRTPVQEHVKMTRALKRGDPGRCARAPGAGWVVGMRACGRGRGGMRAPTRMCARPLARPFLFQGARTNAHQLMRGCEAKFGVESIR